MSTTEPPRQKNTSTPAREYDVPEDAPAYECPYCAAVEPQADLLELHVGVEHEDQATEDELDDFDHTFERESNRVFIYHLKVIVMVTTIYFIFLFAYGALT